MKSEEVIKLLNRDIKDCALWERKSMLARAKRIKKLCQQQDAEIASLKERLGRITADSFRIFLLEHVSEFIAEKSMRKQGEDCSDLMRDLFNKVVALVGCEEKELT